MEGGVWDGVTPKLAAGAIFLLLFFYFLLIVGLSTKF